MTRDDELIDRLIKAGHIKVDPEQTFGEKMAESISMFRKAAVPLAITPSEDAKAMARTMVDLRVCVSPGIAFPYRLSQLYRDALELDIANAIETGRQQGKTKLNLTDAELNLLTLIGDECRLKRDTYLNGLGTNRIGGIAKKVLAYHLECNREK